MADEDPFDDLDETSELLKRISDLEDQNAELACKNQLLEDDRGVNLETLEQIRAYFEVRFSQLKDHPPDTFLNVAFQEIDKLQDSYAEIIHYLVQIFPDLKDISQEGMPAAVISRIDDLKKKYSEPEGKAQQPAQAASDSSEQYKHEIDALKQRNVLLEEQVKAAEVKAAGVKPVEPLASVGYQAEIDALKQRNALLEDQVKAAEVKAAGVKPVEPLASVGYQAEIDALKKDSEEIKQRLEAELQGKEQKLAELIAAHSAEITVLQQKLGKSDRVAMRILGKDFAEYQNQSFSDDDAMDQWLIKNIHAGFVPINDTPPNAKENAIMHAIIRKKIKEFAQKLKPEIDSYITSVNNDRSVLIRDVYTALMKHAGALITDNNERSTNVNNALDETNKIFNKVLNQYEYDELV